MENDERKALIVDLDGPIGHILAGALQTQARIEARMRLSTRLQAEILARLENTTPEKVLERLEPELQELTKASLDDLKEWFAAAQRADE